MRSRSSGTRPSPGRAPGRSRAGAGPLVLVRVVAARRWCRFHQPSSTRCRVSAITRGSQSVVNVSDGTRIRIASCSTSRNCGPTSSRGAIDTVVVAFTDMQGRSGQATARRVLRRRDRRGPSGRGLQLPARARDGDGPVPGYAIASWERGYGDFGMVPDLATLRRIPWLEGTALVLCDVQWHDGPGRSSPRQVLRAQMERAALGRTSCSAPSSSSSSCARRTRRHEKGYRT